MRYGFAVVWALAAAVPAAAQGVMDGYADHEGLSQQVRALAQSPHVKAESLAKTLGGRDVWLLTVGEGETGDKPAILIVGSTHAPHLLGGELAMKIAKRLASDEAAELRQRFTFYIIPRPNPDAAEAFFVERTGNERPTDDDRDGQTNEDGPEDLDGDGFITMMRITDPAGDMMPHPDDPRVLIQADTKKRKRGVFKLLTEGVDNDKDELFNEDGPGGVDFNRNFPFDYPFFTPGAGPHQVSENETRAIADFCLEHTNIAAVLSFGVNDNLAHPWKPDAQAEKQPVKTTLLADDAPYYDFVAGAYKELRKTDNAPESGDGKGSFVKWAYFHYGRWAFEARAWWVPKIEGKKPEGDPAEKEPEKKEPEKKPDTRGADTLNALRWFEENNVPGFSPWAEVKHPDFPDKKVEVGGIRPFYTLNPPATMVPELAETHFSFVQKIAELLPRVEIANVKAEPLGGGLHRITATFVNEGYLPTMTAMGKVNHTPYPLNITLSAPKEATWVSGSPRSQIELLSGNGGREEKIWLLRTDATEIELTIHSPAVGRASRKVPLQ